MFTWNFWRRALERAIRAGASSIVGLWSTAKLSDLSGVNAKTALSAGGFAAITSVLLSLMSTAKGDSESASLVE